MPELVTHVPLGGSTNGEPIHITATTSGGAQTIHTAPAQGFDLVEVYANNQHSGAVVITFELGTGSGAAKNITVSLDADKESQEPVLRDLYMRNSLTLKAYAATTAVINLMGFAQRYD